MEQNEMWCPQGGAYGKSFHAVSVRPGQIDGQEPRISDKV